MLACLNCKSGCSCLQRKLIIIWRSAWDITCREINFMFFCLQQNGILPKSVILLVLKGTFSLSNLPSLMYVNNMPTTSGNYINTLPQISNYILKFCSRFLSTSLVNFHINFTYLRSQHSQLRSQATFCLICSTRLSILQLCFKRTHLILYLS